MEKHMFRFLAIITMVGLPATGLAQPSCFCNWYPTSPVPKAYESQSGGGQISARLRVFSGSVGVTNFDHAWDYSMMTAERGIGAPSEGCGSNSVSALDTDYSWGTQTTLQDRYAIATLNENNSFAFAGISPPPAPNPDSALFVVFDAWRGFRSIHQDPNNFAQIIRYTLSSNSAASDIVGFDLEVLGEEGAYLNLEVNSNLLFAQKTTSPGSVCSGYTLTPPPWLGISGGVSYTWSVDGVSETFTPSNGFFWARNGGLEVGALSGSGTGFIGPISTSSYSDPLTGVFYQSANVEGGWVILATRHFEPGTYRVVFTRNALALQSRTVACDIADFNHDGTVDFFDYADFVAALADELLEADINNDGVVDIFDYLDFVAASEECTQ
jgi:hypothetical protein